MVEGAPGVPDQLSYTAEVSINYNFLKRSCRRGDLVDKVVYTYKEEGEGSSVYKHAIIPRREWWEKQSLWIMNTVGNSFFSLPKCKVVFVRWYLTCRVVPYKKYL